jgi:hypothetical protein
MQTLQSKMSQLVAEVQQALGHASSRFQASVAAFLSNLGDPPDWRTNSEAYTFWAAQWLGLSSPDKLIVRSPFIHLP